MRSARPHARARRALSFLMSLMLATQLLGAYAPAALAEAVGEAVASEETQGDGRSPAEGTDRKEADDEDAARDAARKEADDEDAARDAARGKEAAEGSEARDQDASLEAQGDNTADARDGNADVRYADVRDGNGDAQDDDAADTKDAAAGAKRAEDADTSDAKTSRQDAGPAKEPEATPQEEPTDQKRNYAVFNKSTSTLTFYWGVVPAEADGQLFVADENGNYPPRYEGRPFQDLVDDVKYVVFDDSLMAEDGTSHLRPTNTTKWFIWLLNVKWYTGLERIDMSRVTDMSYMFEHNHGLNHDGSLQHNDGRDELAGIEGWDVSNVTNMSDAFCGAHAYKLDLSRWDVSNVTNFSSMFNGSYVTELDISGWNTSRATDMSYMFNECLKLHKITLGKDFSFKGAATDPRNWAVLYTPEDEDDYDGKWVYTEKADGVGDEVPVGTVMTAEELRDSYDGATMAGTWEWNLLSYTVHFDANGGNGKMDDQKFRPGEEKKLTANDFTYEGHDFVGWNTEADGSGTDYEDEATMAGIEADLALHAQWKVKEYTVTFDAAGGTMDEAQASQQVEHGGKAKRPKSPTKEGQAFAGWYADEGLTQKYDFASPVTADLTLCAKWRGFGPVDYVDENGGTQTRAEGQYTPLTEAMDGQALTDDWYAVLGDVVLAERPEIIGTVHLILCDDATLTASKGINLTPGNELWIYGQEGQNGALEATATEDFYSGIGGGPGEAAGDIVICGGEITARGERDAAGIGGGCTWDKKYVKHDVYGGKVTITGGKVVAIAGDCGAGIGGGYGAYYDAPLINNNGGEITITGGTVKAVSPSYYGAGIGGGGSGGNSGRITISGDAKVEAEGGSDGAAIGGGSYGTNGEILISGDCEVTATTRGYGAGIGTGMCYGFSWGESHYDDLVSGPISIAGNAKVKAVGGGSSAGIGGGNHATLGSVTISDSAEVEATGRAHGPGIGSGYKAIKCGTINITGGTVTAKGITRTENGSGLSGAGIGLAYDSPAESGPIVNISGGKVTAQSEDEGAGIGGAYRTDGGDVTISGDAWVEAIGGERCPGIGGGYDHGAGSLKVMGGTVIARGGASAAGIGGGDCGNGGTVEISAGTVTAIGGEAGPGIGGGCSFYNATTGGTVTISGGTVVAQGGKYAAGIGSGNAGNGVANDACELTISGDAKVLATGGDKAAGIGGGTLSAGGTLVVNASADVTAQAGTGEQDGTSAQAIGHGAGNDDAKSIELYSAAGVHYREAEGAARQAANYDERVDKCRLYWARITTSPLVYVLTLDANDGGEEPETCEGDRVVAGETFIITECPFNRAGYKVTGWNTERDGSGTAYALGASVTPAEDLTLYAQWAECSYTVAFDPNGGAGNMAEQTIGYDETQKLAACAFEREGYGFAGWNTKAGGSGDAYGDGDEVTNLADENGATVTLFAQWKINTYAVTFDPNGGELDELQRTQQVEHGSRARRPAGARRTGHVLAGWFADGAEEAYDFETPVTGDLALTARWDELEPVGYLDERGEPQTRKADEYETLTADASGQVLSDGWYAVLGNVDLPERPNIDGVVHLILTDGSTLTAEKGINLTPGNELWVYWQQGKTGALEATGPKYAAGVGGGVYESAGDFVLAGGKVTATGGEGAAGVGGGSANVPGETHECRLSAGGAVTVYAGELAATGGDCGAGIGGGQADGTGFTTSGGTFKIYGGAVVAQGGEYGAGIGSGHAGGKTTIENNKSLGGTFEASGGSVEARGGHFAAGIGCGSSWYAEGKSGVVKVSGEAEVSAYGGKYSAGVGCGDCNGTGPEVTVEGGKLTARGGDQGAGIGGGLVYTGYAVFDGGDAGKVTVTGGEVEATGGDQGAGIGGGMDGNAGMVTVSGGTVTATGGRHGAGIGCGDFGRAAGSLEVSGGKVVARAGFEAAGIGGGYGRYAAENVPVTVTITGGEVEAYGSQRASAIGGGCDYPGGTVTISGGKVLADGRYYDENGKEDIGGAGIGTGGNRHDGSTLVIEGPAEVTAIGGLYAAGIGGPSGAAGSDVTIRATKAGAPKVTATGGELCPGIGSGRYASKNNRTAGSVAIDGACEVTAIGGAQAAGIGGGWEDPGAKVTIGGGATVTAQAGALSDSGRITQAIGHGDLAKGDSTGEMSGELTIYPEAKVLRGNAEDGVGAVPALAAERVDDCRSHLWAQISPCDHPDIARVPTADKLHHTVDCTHCLGTRDSAGALVECDHEFVEDADGAECACGVRASRVSFDANADDAKGEMDASELINEALPYDIPACAFSRVGRTFAGWNTAADGSGEAYADRATIEAVGRTSTTLYAQWRTNAYKVAFDKNAGDATGSMAEQGLAYGADPVALARNAFARKGHTFAGWNTKADGSGTAYADEAKVADLTSEDGATVKLFAQWRANDYKVAFDKNAGDATGTMAEQAFTYGAAPVALSRNAFSRKGHAFAGWNTKADGSGTAYADGARVRNLADKAGARVTLFAQWRANTYTVSFDSAGGSAVASQRVTYGRQARRPASPTKGAWTFGGWYADAALKRAYDFSGPVTGNLTLHAKWVRTSIAKAAVGKVADQAYTGKAVTPKPTVKLGSKTLRLNTDYTLSYKSNVKAGTATVTATGKGAYTGSASRTFRIVAPAGSATATLLDGRRSTAALGKTCGTVGKSMTMTSLALSLAKPFPVKGGIEYRTHVQTTGWEKAWKRDGAVAGNPRQKKRLEGIQIRLYGDMAKTYDVYYRAHVQRVGWMAWAKNGASAGSQSGSRRMEAVQVVLVPKGAKAPANAGAATKAVFVDYAKKK